MLKKLYHNLRISMCHQLKRPVFARSNLPFHGCINQYDYIFQIKENMTVGNLGEDPGI